jgi:hypothetical protein
MHLTHRGVTEPMDIAAFEAIIFRHFAPGGQVEIRPEDTEPDVRGRFKSQLIKYDEQRSRKFNGDLFQEVLYQMWLYWAVVPEYPRCSIDCYADLCEFAYGLPGKRPSLAGVDSTEVTYCRINPPFCSAITTENPSGSKSMQGLS